MFFNDWFGSVLFNGVPFFVSTIFILVFGIIFLNIIKGVRTWSYNNKQPILTVVAKVVTKRVDVSSSMHHDANSVGHHGHTVTTYYVAFEVESGDRMEFRVPDEEYGVLVEGDMGKLTFQGSRYFGYRRTTAE